MIFLTILVVVSAAVGAFFWAWSAVPSNRVPPHLSGDDLKRLETEDRLRQTSYQVLAGVALVFTFLLTVYQAIMSYNQWNSDYALRMRQAEVTHLAEALKALSLETNAAARVAGYFSLRQLVLQYPEEALLTTGVLTHSVRSIANDRDPFSKSAGSWECGGVTSPSNGAREDADPEVQVAMNILGDQKLASLRSLRFDGAACKTSAGSTSFSTINLSHLALDNLDLNGSDFSCLDMTQSHFRRTNFRDASLQGTNFGGSTFDDWKTPGFLKTIDEAQPDTSGTKRADWLFSSGQDWMRYRCWIADFRGANLTNAVFSGAGLAGVDFRDSNLTGAQFENANISRANFRGAKVKPEQLLKACAGEQPLHDFNISIRSC
jgi:uncharacterized protein YjbI with pentapeptide repeats